MSIELEQDRKVLLQIRDAVASGNNAIWIKHYGDEERAIKLIENFAGKYDATVFTWRILDTEKISPIDAIKSWANASTKAVHIMLDVAQILNVSNLNSLSLRRIIKDSCHREEFSGKPLFLVCDGLDPVKEMEPYFIVIEVPFPDEVSHLAIVDYIIDSASSTMGLTEYSDDQKLAMANALKGLSCQSATSVLAFAICKKEYDKIMEEIESQKAAVINSIRGVKYIPKSCIPDSDFLVGFEYYLNWLKVRSFAFSSKAKEIDPPLQKPKGIIFIGPPGTGKTEMGKITAKLLNLPLISVNLSEMLDRYVGSSEQTLAKLLKMAEVMPCCLLIDEAEKFLAGAHLRDNDGNVSRNMLSLILKFQEQNTFGTFTILLMNRAKEVAQELVRSGRFDSIFYTDLPDREQQLGILIKHLDLQGCKYNKNALEMMVDSGILDNYAGADIKQLVIEARSQSYFDSLGKNGKKDPNEISTKLLTEKSKDIRGVGTVNEEDISEIRDFCKKHARPVGKNKSVTPTKKRRRIINE